MLNELEQAWNDLQAVPSYIERFSEEEACWVILEREREANTPVVEVEISVDALCVEVR